MRLFACFLTAIILSYVITPFVIRLAFRFNILDHPDKKRKAHKNPTPLLGGLVIVISVIACSFLKPYIIGKGMPLLLGGLVIFLINLLDDLRGLSARFRVTVEICVTLLVISSGIRASFLPPGPLGVMGEVLITLIWFVGITNAFNYLDGLDGLATGSACINFFYFSLVLYLLNQAQLGFLALILLGSCFGFLLHNFPKAKMFLGDAGSTFLGFMLAGISLLGNWADHQIVKLCIPILILGVPIFDMTFTTFMRIKKKKVSSIIEWLKYGARDHFHHYLLALGLSPLSAVIFIWTITFSLGLSGVMLSNDTPLEGLMTIVQASIIFSVIGVLIVIGEKAEH